jgi:hypothetical protein
MIKIEFDGLDELIHGVEMVASKAMEETSSALSQKTLDLALESYYAEEDPYGNMWDDWKVYPYPSISRSHEKLMIDTGALFDSIDVVDVNRHGFLLGSFGATGFDGRGHAHFHQYGTSKMVARQFLPEDGLPPLWFPIYVDVFEDTLRRIIF